ncbi:MAG: iron hydrogenase small subunit [Defluviitaleaceae bacterium]|nr:iron hydrogenase small subunit [Defluviitaleaceae bacterium]
MKALYKDFLGEPGGHRPMSSCIRLIQRGHVGIR